MTSKSPASPLPPDKLELLSAALNSPPPTREEINDLRARVLADNPLTPEEYYKVLHIEATLQGSLKAGDEGKPRAKPRKLSPSELLDLG